MSEEINNDCEIPEDKFEIQATSLQVQEVESLQLTLKSLDSDFSYKMHGTELVIGREAELADFLALKTYVSRKHARIFFRNNNFYLENLSKSNKTYLNSELITEIVPLHVGDEIGLGGKLLKDTRQQKAAYFICEIK